MKSRMGREAKWTKELVAEEARKYKTRSEFQLGSAGAYIRARRDGYLDEVCVHMQKQKHGFYHCVYLIINRRLAIAYIGVTRQIFKKRIKQHKSNNNETNSREISNLSDTEFIQLTDYLYSPNDIKTVETQYFTDCKLKGYEMLNTTGALGTVGVRDSFWTLEAVENEARKYSGRSEFQYGSSGAYDAAKTHGWLEQICSHMEVKKRHWTINKIQDEANKFSTRNDFKNAAPAAYDYAYKNGWLDTVCSHMKEIKKAKGYWTYELVKKTAAKYKTAGDFNREEPKAYNAAMNNDWFRDVCSHMVNLRKPRGYWTFENIAAEAKLYKSRIDFAKGCESAYKAALEKGWINDVCAHMVIA